MLRVTRRGPEAVHFVQKELEPGASVLLSLDWERRFDHMQQHSGPCPLPPVAPSHRGTGQSHTVWAEVGVSAQFVLPNLGRGKAELTALCPPAVPGAAWEGKPSVVCKPAARGAGSKLSTHWGELRARRVALGSHRLRGSSCLLRLFPTTSSSPTPPGMSLGWFPNIVETSAEKIHFGREFFSPCVQNSKPSLAHLFQDSTSSLPLQT